MARLLRVPPLGRPQILALGIVVLVVAALVFAGTNTAFYVYAENVHIEGARYTPAETIYRHAEVDSYHVFFLNPRRIAARIEALPYIRRAHVQVNFPAGVWIRVEERTPVLVWERGDGAFWVDEEGVVLPILEERPSLMRLVDPEALAAVPQEDEDAAPMFDATLLAAILTVQRRLPDARVVHYESTTGLHIIVPTRGGSVDVILGPLTGLEERLARLPDILAQVNQSGRRVTRIDLTRPIPVYWEE